MNDRTVAILYTCRSTSYASCADVDLWPVERDARLYAGPWPVIAHPPCAKWGNYAGGRGRAGRLGDDDGCGTAAVEAVRAYSGVLEHPANSRLWDAMLLPRPGYFDGHGGRTVVINQSWFGHRAEKRSWLYVCGVDLLVPQLCMRPKGETVPVELMGRAERERTPIAMCEWLLASIRQGASCLAV